MNIEKRKREIEESMKSFPKASYHKSEILQELFALQKEVVALTFNEDHTEFGNLKIWDVESHLAKMNDEYDGVATDSLRRFQSGSRLVCNMIKSEISGNRGESKAFYSLEKIQSDHITLKNIELSAEGRRTEIDGIVITNRGAFIIEVKNTSKDIFIDEKGDYYRTGEYLRWDSNIVTKLNDKIELLQATLQKDGLAQIEVFEIVVFTNNRIEVRNRCDSLLTCFLGQLPYIIDEWNTGFQITSEEIHRAANSINEAKCEESYPMDFDVNRFKRDFATLMAELEAASMAEIEESIITKTYEKEAHKKPKRLFDILDNVFSIKHLKVAGTAATVVLALGSAFFTVKDNY